MPQPLIPDSSGPIQRVSNRQRPKPLTEAERNRALLQAAGGAQPLTPAPGGLGAAHLREALSPSPLVNYRPPTTLAPDQPTPTITLRASAARLLLDASPMLSAPETSRLLRHGGSETISIPVPEAVTLARVGLERWTRRPDGMPVHRWQRTPIDRQRYAAARTLASRLRHYFPNEASSLPAEGSRP